MTDVYEILRSKENDIVRVRKEIQALKVVAPILLDSDDLQVYESNEVTTTLALGADAALENPGQSDPSTEGEEIMSQAIPPKRSRLRDLLGLASGE